MYRMGSARGDRCANKRALAARREQCDATQRQPATDEGDVVCARRARKGEGAQAQVRLRRNVRRTRTPI